MANHPIVVIGAGIAGLTAANELRSLGKSVFVIDKGRAVGGRVATRTWKNGLRFDHGAQFFTCRSDELSSATAEWQAAGKARIWTYGFQKNAGFQNNDGHPRFVGVGGMRAIPQQLASSLDIRLATTVQTVRRVNDEWRLTAMQGDSSETTEFITQELIVTAPLPQSLALIGSLLPDSLRESLQNIEYERCFALMVETERPVSDALAMSALQIPDGEPITFIADNCSRGTASRPGALTIHSSHKFALQNWDADPSATANLLIEAAKGLLPDTAFGEWQLHRWKFSKPINPHSEHCVRLAQLNLTLAGDAFGESRVEGAYLSGLAAAYSLTQSASLSKD
jgi:renalase